jgi:formylglycine-generating enzyme required for sulfatase activity
MSQNLRPTLLLAILVLALIACKLISFEDLDPTATPLMVLIPAGEFQMGLDADHAMSECQKFRSDCVYDWYTNAEPVHTVSLDAFYIDVYEVTNARYAECVDSGHCNPPPVTGSATRDSYYGDPSFANYPAIHIDWPNAQAYCEWRGGSLPTEAQWEKAASGGLAGALYPWGDETPTCKRANASLESDDCKAMDTKKVGSYGANGYGLYDMSGNVEEWVFDYWLENFYTTSPFENPVGPALGAARVLRGGSWYNREDALRVAFRDWVDPSEIRNYFGFRCARNP